ncbi:MAG: hypothetical protein RIR48_824, partial [Bacteroidota bacterium]
MKRIFIYSAIIVFIGLSFIGWDFYKIHDLTKNDQHYLKKSSFEYTNAEKNEICIIRDSNNAISYFKIEGFTSDHQLCVRFGAKPSLIQLEELEKITFSPRGNQIHTSQRWVSDIFNDATAWKEELTIISQRRIEDINANNKVYSYHNNSKYFVNVTPDLIYFIPYHIIIILVAAVLI